VVFWPEPTSASPQLDATYRDLLLKPLIGLDGEAVHQQLRGRWTVYATLSAKIDADGLLNEASRRQLTLLKSVAAQFHGNGLKVVIALRQGPENAGGNRSLANEISDLDFNAAAFVEAPATVQNQEEPLLLLVSPELHVIKAWRDEAGASELGIAVRQALGNPAYSQIIEDH
jgi:hypothetical protein